MIYTVHVKPGSKKGPLVEEMFHALDGEVSVTRTVTQRTILRTAQHSAQRSSGETAPKELVVYLQAKAVDGAANKQLVEVLAKHFGVRKSDLSIVRGEKSRIKHVLIKMQAENALIKHVSAN